MAKRRVKKNEGNHVIADRGNELLVVKGLKEAEG